MIKLGDFGFSKMLKEQDFAQTRIGTPYYMAPELWEGKEYDAKVDVWALGVCFFEMLYGDLPFKS